MVEKKQNNITDLAKEKAEEAKKATFEVMDELKNDNGGVLDKLKIIWANKYGKISIIFITLLIIIGSIFGENEPSSTNEITTKTEVKIDNFEVESYNEGVHIPNTSKPTVQSYNDKQCRDMSLLRYKQ